MRFAELARHMLRLGLVAFALVGCGAPHQTLRPTRPLATDVDELRL